MKKPAIICAGAVVVVGGAPCVVRTLRLPGLLMFQVV